MTIPLQPKRPAEVRKYPHDWEPFLGDTATISGTPTTTAAGALETSDVTSAVQSGNKSVIFTVTGGDPGVGTITQTIVTSDGRTETETFTLQIAEADEPVNLPEAKAQCRMTDDDSEDEFIESLIPQARAYVEKVSTYSFVAGQRTFTFGSWGDYLEIYLRPVTGIPSVAYIDEAGASIEAEAVDPALVPDGFMIPLGRYPLRIYPGVNGSFPALAEGGSITVTATAGSLGIGSHEYLIGKRAMLVLIAHWFEYREAAVLGAISSEVAFAIKEMLDTLRPVSAY